jgi:hypothetical protein
MKAALGVGTLHCPLSFHPQATAELSDLIARAWL